MNLTLVKRDDVLHILLKNRQRHITDYAETMLNRQIDILTALKKAVKDVSAGKEVTELSFPLPEDNTKVYDAAIRKLELEQRNELELDAQTFERWVMDEWHWKDNFVRTASVYNAKVLR